MVMRCNKATAVAEKQAVGVDGCWWWLLEKTNNFIFVTSFGKVYTGTSMKLSF